nr:uncharacterized protein LOC133593370 [Nerophis lumbriciformis]
MSRDSGSVALPLAAGRRVLVTGGAGFLGSHLVEALLERGCRVAVIDDLSTGRFENIAHLEGHPRFTIAIDSITHEVVLDHLVRDADMVFHLAASVGVELVVQDPVHALEGNILGTRSVLSMCQRYRKKYLLTSTSEVYGKSDAVPFSEGDDLMLGPTAKARWSYASSKVAAEHLSLAYHRQHGLPVVIVRLFNTVGPRQLGRYGMVIPRFVQQALAGEPLTVHGDGRQRRCFCHVSDAVRAILALAEHPDALGQVYNIGSTEEVSILELAQRVLGLVRPEADPEVAIRLLPYEKAYGPGFEDMRRRLPSIDKIASLVGWQPTIRLDETLRRVVEFQRQQGLNRSR